MAHIEHIEPKAGELEKDKAIEIPELEEGEEIEIPDAVEEIDMDELARRRVRRRQIEGARLSHQLGPQKAR